jgi:ribonuclease P protein component
VGQRPVARVVARRTFVALRRPAGRGRSGPVAAAFAPLPAPDGRPQVAFAVAKRCGGSVQRNRLRRRLRAAADAGAETLAPGAYLLRPDPEALELPYAQLEAATLEAMARAAST